MRPFAGNKAGRLPVVPPPPGHVRRTRTRETRLPGLAPLFVDVRRARADLVGVPDELASLECHAQANARSESQAQRLLNHVEMKLHGDYLRLASPLNRRDRHRLSQFRVACPRRRFVTVRGIYAAVSLSNLDSGAEVETTHARISISNVSRAVTARVLQGIIDYAGHQGSVALSAGWEINLNFTAPLFSGSLDANSQGAVRVLLPPGFATSFEATVANQSDFVCRADIKTHISHSKQHGRSVYRFGDDLPAIRLISAGGPIVIDNLDGPWEDAMEGALLRPRLPQWRAACLQSPIG